MVTAYNGFRDVTIAIRGAKLKHMLSANNLWIGCHVHLLWQVLSFPKDCPFQSLQSTLNIDTHFFLKSQNLWIVIDTKGFWIETKRTFSGSLSISFDKQTNKENVYKEMYFFNSHFIDKIKDCPNSVARTSSHDRSSFIGD